MQLFKYKLLIQSFLLAVVSIYSVSMVGKGRDLTPISKARTPWILAALDKEPDCAGYEVEIKEDAIQSFESRTCYFERDCDLNKDDYEIIQVGEFKLCSSKIIDLDCATSADDIVCPQIKTYISEINKRYDCKMEVVSTLSNFDVGYNYRLTSKKCIIPLTGTSLCPKGTVARSALSGKICVRENESIIPQKAVPTKVKTGT